MPRKVEREKKKKKFYTKTLKKKEKSDVGGLWLNTYNVELVDFHVHLIYSRSCAEIKCKLWDKNEVQKKRKKKERNKKVYVKTKSERF